MKTKNIVYTVALVAIIASLIMRLNEVNFGRELMLITLTVLVVYQTSLYLNKNKKIKG